MRSRMNPDVSVPVTSVRLQPRNACQFRDPPIPFKATSHLVDPASMLFSQHPKRCHRGSRSALAHVQ
jgi:hypothetical protein